MVIAVADGDGKIPKITFEVVTGTLFGTAIIAAAMRTAVRLHLQRRLFLDDAFLMIACAALTGGFAMLYQSLYTLFLIQHFAQEGSAAREEATSAGINVAAEVHKFQILDFVHEPLLWVVMFSVKASFLVFFRHLVSRVEKLVVYWKAVCAVNVVAFAFCVCYTFIACPHTDSTAIQCDYGSQFTKRSGLTTTGIIFDVATDILIVSIPARVLWQVRIDTRQKLGIGAFLGLSIFMILFACIRLIGFHLSASYGYTWQFFWFQVEGCVAVTMVSITAFRSVFVTRSYRASGKKARPWYSSTVARLKKARKPTEDHDLETLPGTPAGAMTGMRTFIRGSRLSVGPETYDELTGYEPSKRTGREVVVTQDVSWEEEKINPHGAHINNAI